MRKKLVIIESSPQGAETRAGQVRHLFGEALTVTASSLETLEDRELDGANLVLMPSYEVYDGIRHRLVSGCEVVFACRTVSRTGLENLKGLGLKTGAVLLDDTVELARQMVSVLRQIDPDSPDLIPAALGECDSYRGRAVVSVAGPVTDPGRFASVTDIGPALLDISTILELGMRLDLDDVLNHKNIKAGLGEIVPVHVGLSVILGKTNRFESSMDLLLQVVDSGVVGINARGRVFSYNEKAGQILGTDIPSVLGKNGMDLFPEIPFGQVMATGKPIREALGRINGYDVVMSVDPIAHSGKQYGAVAVIKRFSDEERKQHLLRNQLLGKGHRAKYRFEEIVGGSEALRKCREIALRMAGSDSSILITGESGTGKEIFAQAIHNSSGRRAYQFVAVNCGAIPENLLESELFGYEDGAFTGARKGGRQGLFELAHKGTLFLDEIGEMPLALQKRLLRVLQEREVVRLGGDRVIPVDVRIIAATNRELKSLAEAGGFREDLYYRLSVLPLAIPPLRSRPADIPDLIHEFQKKMNAWFRLTDSALGAFMAHPWRGNVRELRNYIEYLANLNVAVVEQGDLPFAVSPPVQTLGAAQGATGIPVDHSRFILEQLALGLRKMKRLGRRSLCRLARENGLFLGEQAVRNLLLALEKQGLVVIHPGKGGTVITEAGLRALDQGWGG